MLSCERSEESCWELGFGHHRRWVLAATRCSLPMGRPRKDARAACRHGLIVTGFDLCYLVSPLGAPVGHLSGCSLFLFSVPCQRLIMPQPSRQSSSMSLPSISSFPTLSERLLAASPFLCSPRGKLSFILESHIETRHLSSSFAAVPSSVIMISPLPTTEHRALLI